MSSTSTSGAAGNVFAVDANALMAALLRGKAMRVLTSPGTVFFTTVRTTWEVERYLPDLATVLARRGIATDAEEQRARFHALPLIAMPERVYQDRLPRARRMIADRDPDDADLLALALHLDIPIWTNDRDFFGLSGVRAINTAEMLSLVTHS